MKKLPMPDVVDTDILDGMRNYNTSSTGALICAEYANLHAKYIEYNSCKGNPWSCIGNTISEALRDRLEYHYNSPRTDLQYINEMRRKGSPDVCPLCGSAKTSTLDHYLPQANYPEWIVHSRNLVPACDCNSKRQNDVKGTNNNQRVLHPYFDECLTSRLVITEITGDLLDPDIDLICVNRTLVHRDTVQFHINTVVKRSTVFSWMEVKWQTLVREPRLLITAIPRERVELNMHGLETCLRETLSDKDDEYGTKNNWYSMLIAGILSSKSVKVWLLSRHNAIVNGLIDRFD